MRVLSWFLGLACAGVGLMSTAKADEPEVYVALKHRILFNRLGFESQGRPLPTLGRVGVWYGVTSAPHGAVVHEIRLAAHTSRAAAESAAEAFCRSISISPGRSGEFTSIGDKRYVWLQAEDSGTVVFLRENALVAFSWSGPREQGVALARRIDHLIRTDREIAPRGSFTEAPQIVATGVPLTISRSATVSIRLGARGLGDGSIRFAVFDDGRLTRLSLDDAEGALTIRSPERATAGPVRLVMVAANEDNVFVAKEFTIEVTE